MRRARELRDLYNGLVMTELTRDERLALLQTVRPVVKVRRLGLTNLVSPCSLIRAGVDVLVCMCVRLERRLTRGQEFDTKLTREIVDLLDREENLLTRGLRSDSLDGARAAFVLADVTIDFSPGFLGHE